MDNRSHGTTSETLKLFGIIYSCWSSTFGYFFRSESFSNHEVPYPNIVLVLAKLSVVYTCFIRPGGGCQWGCSVIFDNLWCSSEIAEFAKEGTALP